MSPHGAAILHFPAAPIGEDALLADVIAGLRQPQKQLHPKYFYDEIGSDLFEQITHLPEYYLTRTEIAILQAHLPRFARQFGYHARVIEPGSGAGTKTILLLDALLAPAAYVPVDISPTYLEMSAPALRERYPATDILPVCADFTQPFQVPQGTRPFDRILVFFPGSTIGNLDPDDAIRMLRQMGRMAGRYGKVMVGADLKKSPKELEAAYNDSQGVTAAFNRNILRHLNQRFDATFDPESFAHYAFWNPRAGRIEMHLVSSVEQTVRIGGKRIPFARDESIWTESCHKYDNAQFADMARRAGLAVEEVWTDDDKRFSVQLMG